MHPWEPKSPPKLESIGELDYDPNFDQCKYLETLDISQLSFFSAFS